MFAIESLEGTLKSQDIFEYRSIARRAILKLI